MGERESILADLAALKDQARREGKWIWCPYQNLWFSPNELDAANAAGSFIWGLMNWSLRDPNELLGEAQREADEAVARLAELRDRVSGNSPEKRWAYGF